MVDRVRPLKLESSTRGTEVDEFPTELDPSEDYIEVRGVMFQNDTSDDEVAYLSRDASNELIFKDTNLSAERTLRWIRTVQNLYSGAALEGQTVQTDGLGGIQLATVVSGYPPEFDYATALTEQITTSGTFIPAISHTTADLSSGAYLVLAQGTIRGSLSSTVLGVQSQIDDTETFGNISAAPGVKDGDFQFFAHIIKESWSGVHQVDLDYKRSSGGGEAKIRDCRITLWKVGN